MDSNGQPNCDRATERRRNWRSKQIDTQLVDDSGNHSGRPKRSGKQVSWWSTTISHPENIAMEIDKRNNSGNFLTVLPRANAQNKHGDNQLASELSAVCLRNAANRDTSSFITPFAQILAVLRKARDFLVQLRLEFTESGSHAKVCPGCRPGTCENHEDGIDDTTINKTEKLLLLEESVQEVDWCLEVFDKLQWRRSVSSLARAKFCSLISQELSRSDSESQQCQQSASNCDSYTREHSVQAPFNKGCGSGLTCQSRHNVQDALLHRHYKSGKLKRQSTWAPSQISEYIYQTFVDDDQDADFEGSVFVSHNAVGRGKFRASYVDSTRVNKPYRVETIAEDETHENVSPNEEITTTTKSGKREQRLEEEIMEMTATFDTANVNEYLKTTTNISLDIFHLDLISNRHPLVALGLYTFQTSGLLSSMSIAVPTIHHLLYEVERKYSTTAPFHNAMHAADVLATAVHLMSNDSFKQHFSDLELLATYFACVVHDIDHPGLTNQYLINTSSELAILYNDNSVLENHHLAVTFGILSNGPKCDITLSMSKAQRLFFRKLVIRLVLATDMSKHMTMVADFKTMLESQRAAGLDIVPMDTYAIRMQILECLVHAADLGNPTKGLVLYREWVDRITEELFRQGDKERAAGMDISPMCDRQNACINSSQVGFIDFIVYPLWETLSEVLKPQINPLLENLASNREWFFKAGDATRVDDNYATEGIEIIPDSDL